MVLWFRNLSLASSSSSSFFLLAHTQTHYKLYFTRMSGAKNRFHNIRKGLNILVTVLIKSECSQSFILLQVLEQITQKNVRNSVIISSTACWRKIGLSFFNISGALQQISVAAFSETTEVSADLC